MPLRQKIALLAFSLRIFHFMTKEIVHHDPNGHISCNFFDYDMNPSKSCGPAKSSKTRTQNFNSSKIVVLGIEKWFSMHAMIILVIILIIFK